MTSPGGAKVPETPRPVVSAVGRCFPRSVLKDLRTTARRPATTRKFWSGRPDLNRRPLAPKASALPGCATSRLYEHGTLPEHSAGSQLLDNEPYRLPAVADPFLLLGGVLRHRLPGPLDEKDRVVPESLDATGPRRDLPFDAPGRRREHPAGKGRRRLADECRGPRPGNILQFLEKQHVVLLVVRLLARVPGGPDARAASQRVHRQAGVVRDAQDMASLRVMERLDLRVLREGFPPFARLRYVRHVGQRQDLDVPLQAQSEQRLDLVDLPPAPGCDQQFHRPPFIHSFWTRRILLPARTADPRIASSWSRVHGS